MTRIVFGVIRIVLKVRLVINWKIPLPVMDLGSWVWGFGFRVLGMGFWV